MTAEELRDWRVLRGLSQAKLAHRLGVQPLTVSRWERGFTIPNWLTLAIVGLGVTLDAEDREEMFAV